MEEQHLSTIAVEPRSNIRSVETREDEVYKKFVERLSRQDLNPFRKPTLSVLGLRGREVKLWT